MGRLLKWSGKESVNLYLYVIPVIFTLGTSAPCSYITPKAKCHIHIHPPHVECLLLHIAKKFIKFNYQRTTSSSNDDDIISKTRLKVNNVF
jgi:ABC-type uncharacterized transport system permease subunit